jgi:hypothetical protein
LQALKDDVSRLLTTTGDEIFDASKNRAEDRRSDQGQPEGAGGNRTVLGSPSTATKQRAISR